MHFQTLVLNTRINWRWQVEERPRNFPLVQGQSTQLTAAVNDQTIDIYGNKRQFCYSYNHRYDVECVNQVHCYGNGTPVKMWVGKVRALTQRNCVSRSGYTITYPVYSRMYTRAPKWHFITHLTLCTHVWSSILYITQCTHVTQCGAQRHPIMYSSL